MTIIATTHALDSINPATGEVIGQVQCSTAQDYDQILESAQSAFNT
jgi:acyl-CoA reductase-like NAD-dependent aldehyde dehydrogenase